MTDQKTLEQMQIEAQAMQRLQMDRLRDEFAMAAMQGMLADPDVDHPPKKFAALAYDMADAMMAEREARAQGEK